MSAVHSVGSNGQLQGRQEHSVQLYGADERSLTLNVGKYIMDGLQRGESVVVIAEPSHTAAFASQLQLLGADPCRAVRQQQLRFFDAETMLSAFMVDGQPHRTLFQRAVGNTLGGTRDVADSAGKRAYGEMVGLLWKRGEIAAAIALEELWNEYLRRERLQLFCGYPIDIFGEDFQSPAVEKLLLAHTHVVPTGADGDLERAVKRAIQDFPPTGSDPHSPEALPLPPRLVIPNAERTILSLKASHPGRRQEVLIRARGYYDTEKRFREMIENSSDAVLLMSPRGEVSYASPSTARVLGHAPGEIIEGNYFDLIHPDDRGSAGMGVADALATPRRPVQFEVRVRGSAGGWRWVESTVTDLPEEDSIGGLVWNCRDITARRAAEEALRESQRRLAGRERYLQALLDSIPECVKVLGRNGEVLEMNAAGLRMLEADSAEQVLGNCVYPLIDESDRPAFQALTESVFDGGSGGSLEFSITGFKGARRTFETNVVALRDETDRVIGALSGTRDVTERHAAEAALRRANDGLEQFAYAAAHDLQEPIRNVILYTQMLAERYGDKLDPQADEFMTVTVESAQRMQALVQDLLGYTRSLDKPNEKQPGTDAKEVVAAVLANLRTAISSAGAEVVCGRLPVLPIYRVHLVQLLQNLVGNALKYRSCIPPRIEISTVERPDEFVVTVRDNGIGILPDHQERIFGVFKRLHNRSVPGNGIGLAICRRIISHYEGRIWVESQLGQGSAFIFTLPRRRPAHTV
ncbi:MAG TPA: PAS domain S-box protein [Bryobacteraceae bacterium]